MARVKQAKTETVQPEMEAVKEELVEGSINEDNTVIHSEETEDKTTVPSEKVEEAVKEETTIPEQDMKLLKLFSNYPELYITSTGGVYTANTKLEDKKKAILYKNPFYNN